MPIFPALIKPHPIESQRICTACAFIHQAKPAESGWPKHGCRHTTPSKLYPDSFSFSRSHDLVEAWVFANSMVCLGCVSVLFYSCPGLLIVCCVVGFFSCSPFREGPTWYCNPCPVEISLGAYESLRRIKVGAGTKPVPFGNLSCSQVSSSLLLLLNEPVKCIRPFTFSFRVSQCVRRSPAFYY